MGAAGEFGPEGRRPLMSQLSDLRDRSGAEPPSPSPATGRGYHSVLNTPTRGGATPLNPFAPGAGA